MGRGTPPPRLYIDSDPPAFIGLSELIFSVISLIHNLKFFLDLCSIDKGRKFRELVYLSVKGRVSTVNRAITGFHLESLEILPRVHSKLTFIKFKICLMKLKISQESHMSPNLGSDGDNFYFFI